MLILAVGGQEIAAETRLVTTFIGAGVGIGLALALPPPVPTRRAVAQVGRVAAAQADCLDQASASMARQPVTRQEVERWLGLARQVASAATAAAEVVGEVADVRRLNVRALRTSAVEPALRTGLEALDHSALALRSLFVAMHHEAPRQPTPDDGYGEDVRGAFSVLLTEVASCLRAFGALVAAETSGAEADVAQQLSEGLERAREARALLTELLFVDARAETSLWLLRGTLLTHVEQVIVPMDLEERARERERLRGPLAGTRPGVTALVRRSLPPEPPPPRTAPRTALRRLAETGVAAARRVHRGRR